MRHKLKFIEVEYIIIPDHCLQIKYTNQEDFLKHFPLDDEHTFYYKCKQFIYAINSDYNVVYFCEYNGKTKSP